MKKIIIFILFMLGIAIGFGQSDEIKKMLQKRYPDALVVEYTHYDEVCYGIIYNYGKTNQKEGLCDLKGNEILAPNKYTDIDPSGINTGFYSVKIGDKEGVCDLNGKEIITPKYTMISHYYAIDGYFKVYIGDKEGAYDLKGNEIIPCQFSDIKYDVYEKKFIVIQNNTDTNFVDFSSYTPLNLHQTSEQSKVSVSTIKNRYKTDKIAYHYNSVVNGYYSVKLNDKVGLLDLNGKEIISPDKYTSINTYSVKDGFFTVKIGDKVGLLDLKGKEIISPDKYTSINTYSVKDGYFTVKIGDKVGLLDLKGKEIISPDKYTSISTYSVKDGYYTVEIGDKVGLLDLKGKEIISPDKYTSISTYSVKDGYYTVKIGDKVGLLDLKGKEIISPDKYTSINTYSVKDGYYTVKIGDKVGLLDLKGKEIISPDKYTFINTYSVKDGYYTVKIGDNEGLLDLNGKEIISPNKYTSISIYKDGYYTVKIGDKVGLLDLKGKEIISPDKYTSISTYSVKDGYFTVKIGDNEGLLDLNGKEIISPDKYTMISYYHATKVGYFTVYIGDKEGVCDLNGKEIIPCQYKSIYYSEDGYFTVKIGDKEGVCDLNGKEIIPCQYKNIIYSDGKFRVQAFGNDFYTDFEPNNQNPKTPTSIFENKSLILSGSWTLTYENVKLEGKIENLQSEEWSSGTPLLKVYMTNAPYDGIGEIKGHLYCEYKTTPIKGGNVRTINESGISYTKPSAGTYYTVLGLYEYTTDKGYVLVDYMNFNNTRSYTSVNTSPNYQQPLYQQPIQKDYSSLISQYQYWEGQAQNYYQKLGYETNGSLRMSYLNGYKQAQGQMMQIRAQADGYIQKSQFESAIPPKNPGN